MRVSINISSETKALINEIKKKEFAGKRITNGYIINMVMDNISIEKLEKKLFEIKEKNNYQSVKYSLTQQAIQKINKLNTMMSASKDMIINFGLHLYKEELKKRETLKVFKRRYELIMNNSTIKIINSNGEINDLLNHLPGIYSVWISAKGKEKEILYVGKSKIINSRSTKHLSSLLDNPGYFGLTDDDLKNDNLALGVKIEHLINLNKVETFQELEDNLNKEERKHINKLKPHTQKNMNMKNEDEKREVVKKVIDNLIT